MFPLRTYRLGTLTVIESEGNPVIIRSFASSKNFSDDMIFNLDLDKSFISLIEIYTVSLDHESNLRQLVSLL